MILIARRVSAVICTSQIGLLGAKPSITASCYFADPVADITVLGAPDNQSLGDECEQYEVFIEALPRFDVAPPPPPSRMRFAGSKSQPPAFPSVEVALPAHLLSLDRAWLAFLAGFDIVFLTASWLLCDFLLEE